MDVHRRNIELKKWSYVSAPKKKGERGKLLTAMNAKQEKEIMY
jgi:hypothetical protein